MTLLALAVLGGLLALDGTSVGQFMLSRPLVAGLLAGWILGDPAGGLLVGSTLELYLLVSFPTGGARFPEGGTATLVGVAAVAWVDAPGALPLGVAMGLLWGQVGGVSITAQRRLNARLVPEPGSPGPVAPAVVRGHLTAVGLDFLRGAVVTGLGVVLARTATAALAPSWPLAVSDVTGLLLVGGAVSGGIFLRSVGGFRARPLVFVTGLVLGLLGGRFL